MSGGDLRVKFGSIGGMGALNQAVFIDANSKAGGNMTEQVNVNGKDVYMTKEGKALYEANKNNGLVSPEVQTDPGWLSRFFMGDIKESAVGTP